MKLDAKNLKNLFQIIIFRSSLQVSYRRIEKIQRAAARKK